MKLIPLAVALLIGAFIGRVFFSQNPNDRPTYGPTGLPKNCRAIITANIDGWKAGTYSAKEVLGSIERNCGALGYSWKD